MRGHLDTALFDTKVVLMMELRRLLKCRCRSVEDDDDNDTTYFRAIRTATLERRLAEKTLKPRILNEYRDELRRRKHQPVTEEPQFQTLESYDLRACPVYAGEFALDSRAVRRVDNRRSVGGDERGAARTSPGGALASVRPSFGRGRAAGGGRRGGGGAPCDTPPSLAPSAASSVGGWHTAVGAGALEAGRSAFVLGIPGVSKRSLPVWISTCSAPCRPLVLLTLHELSMPKPAS